MRNKVYIYTLSAAFLVGGCATYQSRPVPVRPASSYPLQARPQYSAVPAQPVPAAPTIEGQVQPPASVQPSPSPVPQAIPAPAPQAVMTVQYAGVGLSIGADVLSDPERCKQNFGVDVNRAGVLPVQ
ncbi:MAG: hypothetical protein NUV74_16430, partial [Candidatus Brocadiaceae bacterium]|nr:hypothetical protein [Candidatus Brocadiaceae bacterium]